jgi:DNA-binding MarR family transcriptional regulator
MTDLATSRPRRAAAPRAEIEPAFRSLVRTFGLLKRVMEPYFARFGISGSHWSVLRTLHRCEEEDGLTALRLTDLGERLIVRPPSVTGVVDRLERMGLVARVVSPQDRRVRHVSLTPKGRRLVERVLTHHPAQVSAVLAGLTPPEQRQLGDLLDRLNPHLQTLAEQQETPDEKTPDAAQAP